MKQSVRVFLKKMFKEALSPELNPITDS